MRIKFDHISYLAYFIFFILLYAGGRWALNGLAILLLWMLVALFVRGTIQLKKFNKWLLLPIVFYAFHALSLLWTDNQAQGRFDLEVKLSFFIFPLLFGFQKPLIFGKKFLLFLFTQASLAASILLLLRALWIYSQTGTFPIYSPFSPHLHVAYLSAYLTLNIIISNYLIQQKLYWKQRYLVFASAAISPVIIWAAQSKAGFIIFLLILTILSFQWLRRFNAKLSYGIVLVVLAGAIAFASTNTRFKAMINAVQDYDKHLSGELQTGESTADRIMTWNASIQLIQENFWSGLGNGDVRDALEHRYQKLGYKKPAQLKLNAHNQFFESFLYLGVFGFLSLIALLFLPLFKYKQSVFGLFILTFCLHFLFESMLNTQAGVVFFVFFYVILLTLEKRSTYLTDIQNDYLA